MNAITITFASAADLDTARRQIDKARAYRAKGGQLGTLGCALLLRTLERATDIKTTTTNHEAAPDAMKALERIDYATVAADICSKLGRKTKARQIEFLRSELDRIRTIARAAMAGTTNHEAAKKSP